MSRIAIVFVLLVSSIHAHAQWRMLDSGSSSSFRGIHAVSGKIAWAGGTEGTVLRTSDGGAHWMKCAVPPGAEKLDFRAVWAWDANNAVVMSSGPGDQSRLYSTADACLHWILLKTNDEKDGFWDGMFFRGREGVLAGDPVRGRFYTAFLRRERSGHHASGAVTLAFAPNSCPAHTGEAAFAASNSSLFVFGHHRYILATGGKAGPRALLSPELSKQENCLGVPVPVASGNESSGVFSIFFRDSSHGIAVGGDYTKPNESAGTAAFTSDGGRHWTAATTNPHGYRSSVAWDPEHKAWIAAGTNGSDVSFDDGKTWKRLDDGNWNALSLPFAVGPKGRIATLESTALPGNHANEQGVKP